MISNPQRLFVTLLFLSMFLSFQTASADIGPKPSMEFDFEWQAGQTTIISGVLYECHQADCADGTPLEELGPQRFECDAISCYALAYGFSPYHRIEIEFSDGVIRQSNVFETAGFDSKYKVSVGERDLLVEAKFSLGSLPRTGTVIAAGACILLVLGLLIGGIVFAMHRSKK